MNSQWIEEHLTPYLPAGTDLSVYCRPLDREEPVVYHERVLPSASLIKLPVMSAFFRKEKEGAVSFSENLRITSPVEGGSYYKRGGAMATISELIFHMIVESDNTCTNVLIDRLGMEAVNEEIRCLGLTHTVMQRKMMDFIASRDGRENMTTVSDMGRFFSLLSEGRAVDAVRDQRMLDILSQQEDNCILPAQLPHTVRVDHKTGELDGISHDCGLIYAPSGPFIFCLMADGVSDEPRLFYGLSYFTRAVYDELARS